MEASVLQRKKSGISKGKIKKTLKNVLCRPDPVHWPVISEDFSQAIEDILVKYKVEVPTFKKPHWSQLKDIPKEKRPRPPKLKRIEGLHFGISTCARLIQSKECGGVILDAEVNPQLLVQHIVDACVSNDTPVICLNGLKQMSKVYFGFPTCCLGINKNSDSISQIREKIIEIAKCYPVNRSLINNEIEMEDTKVIEKKIEEHPITFTYLYRTSKKCRVFTPPTQKDAIPGKLKDFGNDFIEVTSESQKEPSSKSKAYMRMIVKRITNNPNRMKK